LRKKYEHEFGSFTDAIISFSKKAGEALLNLFPSGGMATQGPAAAARVPAEVTDKTFVPEEPPAITWFGDSMAKPFLQAKEAVIELDAAIQQLASATLDEMFTALEQAVSGEFTWRNFFNSLLDTVASFMVQFGKALILSAIAAKAFKNLLANPVAALVAGGALVATAAVVKGLLAKGPGGGKPQGLATGGFVTSGGVFQLHKDEMVSLPRGAAVTPAHMATGGGNYPSVIEVKGRLRGSDLDLLSKKTAYRKKRGG
jgi:hypothetical protein